jgi:hypothetical protein
MQNLAPRVFAVLLLLALGSTGRPAASQAIADNSFLIEEAYNQERGVVQHIGTWLRTVSSSPWIFTFTQEWPLWTQAQVELLIPFQRGRAHSATPGLGMRRSTIGINCSPMRGRVRAARVGADSDGSEARGLGSGNLARS